MHDVREASMATFDFAGIVEVEITYRREALHQVEVRPIASHIQSNHDANKIWLRLDRPCSLSIEANGDRFHNLHLFANGLEVDAPDPKSCEVAFIEPGEYGIQDKIDLLPSASEARAIHSRHLFRTRHAPIPGWIISCAIEHDGVSCGRIYHYRFACMRSRRERPYSG